MRAVVDAEQHLKLRDGPVTLRGGAPLVNGRLLEVSGAQVSHLEEGFIVRWQGKDGLVFEVEAHNPAGDESAGWLRCRLQGWPGSEPLDSFGLHFAAVENAGAYLRQGYHSWDGSSYVDPESQDEVVRGYAMTQFLPRYGAGTALLGFERHDRFQQTFTFYPHQPLALGVETLWDRRRIECGEVCASERLFFYAHPSGAEDGLRSWARRIAAAASPAPRLPGRRITGWCSWYNLYAAIHEQNIREHLRSAAAARERLGLDLQVFQIDDGFTPEMGDWLEVKPQFPGGMRPLLEEIRKAGFIPGLWIAPFLVGNRSRLYQQHPDWVLKDRETGGPLVHYRFYEEFRWHKRSEEYYVLDATHPDAFEYLRRVFRTWRQEWGCEYFKTDFMYAGSEYGPQRAVYHTPGLTRIEVWRRVAEMIRQEIGDAIWTGCGCPLWASTGLVDGLRTGHDVGAAWGGERPAPERLRDTATRNFASGILWQSDPDVVMLRGRFHYFSPGELRSLAIYAGMTGGLLLTSDDLSEVPEENLQLFKMLSGLGEGPCRFPLLEHSAVAFDSLALAGRDPVVVQVRPAGARSAEAVFCFNLADRPVQRTYPLEMLGIEGARYVREWDAGQEAAGPVERLEMLLPPHEGRLFFLTSGKSLHAHLHTAQPI